MLSTNVVFWSNQLYIDCMCINMLCFWYYGRASILNPPYYVVRVDFFFATSVLMVVVWLKYDKLLVKLITISIRWDLEFNFCFRKIGQSNLSGVRSLPGSRYCFRNEDCNQQTHETCVPLDDYLFGYIFTGLRGSYGDGKFICITSLS